MHLYRATLQRFCPLVRSSITQRVILHRDVVPRRLMSSVPGGTGENLVYLVLCGGAFAGALTYAYRTVTTDSARFTDRITEIGERPKSEWKPKQWPPKNAEEADEVAEEVIEVAAAEEAEPTPVELVAEVKAEEPTSLVEKAAEAVAEAAEVVAEVAGVVEETAEEVAAVAHEVEKIAEEVEAVAKELETHPLPVVEEATAEITESGTEAASQEEAVTES
ncbi:protein MGARP [Tachysurus vachellii]|uniref:protein MGARP n=1 Tax=Tachysurus vachellii TaxID=175792 RepID=UPI00296AB3BB|nr:protein MGARP [Tachysurus vachellii]